MLDGSVASWNHPFIVSILVLCFAQSVFTFSTEELSMYDLVEELNQNFYEFLGVSKTATSSEIRRAYRKLSLTLHPDRNKEEGAADQFRQLAAVYDVLTTQELRESYDNVLEYGLPDWRMPIFYYRRMRKLSVVESSVVLSLIVTIGHYLVLWAIYFERRLEMDELFSSKLRKKEKKLRKAGVDIDDVIAEEEQSRGLSKPTLSKLLPIQISVGSMNFVINLPDTIRNYIEQRRLRQEEMQRQEEYEREQAALDAADKARPKRQRVPGVILTNDASSASGEMLQAVPIDSVKSDDVEHDSTIVRDGKWAPEEISQLIRLCQRYPAGTPDRWAKIAQLLGRKHDDVTHRVGELKRLDPVEYQRLASLCQRSDDDRTIFQRQDQNGISSKTESSETLAWSAEQQKSLESALQSVPRDAADRWTRIAAAVTGKTEAECIVRYKQLAAAIRAKKQKPKNEQKLENS